MSSLPSSTRRTLASQRGGAGVWILALLVLGGVAFAVYWFAFRKPGGESAGLAARVMPAEVDVLGGVDIARLLSEPQLRAMAKANGVDLDAIDGELAKSGVKLSDLASFVFGGRMGEGGLRDAIVAVQAKTDAKAAVGAVQTVLAMVPEELRGLVSSGRVEALEGGVVLTGGSELLDRALAVSKGQGTPLGAKVGLDDVRAALDTGGMLWVASPIPPDVLSHLPGMVTSTLGGAPSHVGFSATLGDGADLRGAMFIPGADGSKVASALEMIIGALKFRLGALEKSLLANLELSGSGSVIIARVKLSPAQVGDLLKRKNSD